MDQFFNKTDFYLALQSCGLGVIIGALFAICTAIHSGFWW